MLSRAFALLAMMPLTAAWGQAMDAAASPAPAGTPMAAASPAASPSAAPPAAAMAGGTAATATGTGSMVTGTGAMVTGTGAMVTGTGAIVTGTGAIVTGIAPMATGTAPTATGTTGAVLSGTTPAVSGTGVAAAPAPPSPYSIEIDLANQRAYLLKDGHKIVTSPISSGRAGHLTPTGDFEVIQKDLNHFSNLYGKIVEKDSGRVVKAGADSAMPVPKGCLFVPAPMKWFVRFDGAAGMHAGILPGYAASHGCVRMPAAKAELFYETVEVGTPVHVFGTAPVHDTGGEESHGHAATIAKATPKASPKATPKAKHGWWFL